MKAKTVYELDEKDIEKAILDYINNNYSTGNSAKVTLSKKGISAIVEPTEEEYDA